MINIEEVNNMPKPEQREDDTLGPCGCVDYHMADCDLKTGGSVIFTGDDPDDWYDRDLYYHDRY